mgnify:CR=1 FL=1
MTSYPAGWFPDPVGRFDYRYFDGTVWTADVASAGQRYRDPLAGLQASNLPRTFAIAAFVIGLVSLVASTLPIIALVVPVSAVLGCIFAIVALRRHRRGTGRGKGYAIWGLCISLVAAPASIVGITVSTPAFIDAFRLALNPEPPEVTIPVCENRNGSPYAEVVVRNLCTDSRAFSVIVAQRVRRIYQDGPAPLPEIGRAHV